MKTQQSFLVQKFFSSALEVGKAKADADKDPVRVEAGFKSWLTRIRGDMADLKQKVSAHREAGEENLARKAENEHRAKEREFHARLEDRRAKGQWVPAADAPLAAARLRAQPRPAPAVRNIPLVSVPYDLAERLRGKPVEAPKVARVPPAQVARVKAAMEEAKQEREAKAPKGEVNHIFKGEAHQLEEHAKAQGQRLRAEGFKLVERDPISVEPDANGNVSGGETLEHPDGRKAEIRVEFNHNTGKGTSEVRMYAAPKVEVAAGVPSGIDRPLTHPMKAVMTKPEMMLAANKDRKLVTIKRMGKEQAGVSGSYIATFSDGTRAMWKPDAEGYLKADGRYSIDSKIPESKREMVTYAISNAAGFDIVPHNVEVQFQDHDPNASWTNKYGMTMYGKGGPGGAQAFVDGKNGKEQPAGEFGRDAEAGHLDIHRLAALDCLIMNTDRHHENWMKGTDGRYYAIDNGLVLPTAEKAGSDGLKSDPLAALRGKAIPPEVKKELNNLTADHLRQAMTRSGFPEKDIRAIIARHEVLKKLTHWPSVSEMRQKLTEVSKGA